MSITAIFISDPFKHELRIDCDMLKLNSIKDGEICILKDFNNSIFEIKDTIVYAMSEEKIKKQIKIFNTGVVKFNDNIFTCFGEFEEIS